jgi:TetR/AcrR family transcriptional regulator, regulator of biofilm formation and stress response
MAAATRPPSAKPAKLIKALPRPRGAARREALLEAVLRIVADVGADAVTHRRVAEVADLPLASTTYWFESKEHLLTAALEFAAERDIARLNEFAAEPADDQDPIALAIDAIIDPVDENLQATRGSLIATYALLLEAARRPALQAVTRRWTDAYLAVLSDLLKRAGSIDPRGDAELLLAATDGLLIVQLASGTGGDLIPSLRHLATLLVNSK